MGITAETEGVYQQCEKKKKVKYLTSPVCEPKQREQEIKKILQGFDFCMYQKNSLEINDVEV